MVMFRESSSSPTTTGQNDVNGSPFQSVRSDGTLDDYYFETQTDQLGISPQTGISSPLEYSDESEDQKMHHQGMIGHSMYPKNRYQGRQPELWQDNATNVIHFPPKIAASGNTMSLYGNISRALETNETSSSYRSIPPNEHVDIQNTLQDERQRTMQLSFKESVDLQESENLPTDKLNSNWMRFWAYSFRSPVTNSENSLTVGKSVRKKHRRQDSDRLEEYPYVIESIGSGTKQQTASSSFTPRQQYSETTANEESPLLAAPFKYTNESLVNSSDESTNDGMDFGGGLRRGYKYKNRKRARYPNKHAARLAAAFLQDSEANRPPTFGDATSLDDIGEYQITLYCVKYSTFAGICRALASFTFFGSCFMEGFAVTDSDAYSLFHRYALTGLNAFAIFISFVDIWLYRELRRWKKNSKRGNDIKGSISVSTLMMLKKHKVRISRSETLIQPLIFCCFLVAIENIYRVFISPGPSLVLFSCVFKPLMLFYVSSQARDAFEAIRCILRVVVRVLIMELLLILMFAAVACRLFYQYESFHDLSAAWISLFELTTTVVNPSIWMPTYQNSKLSALFFIFFIVTTFFCLHSLVLSVIFQTYIQAATEIHERNSSDKEDSLYLAFQALLNGERVEKGTNNKGTPSDYAHVDTRSVRQTLEILRPHYSDLKINALVEIVDPSGHGSVDYATFCTGIRKALNASIRTARSVSSLATSVEVIAAAVALTNFIYVLLVSFDVNLPWFRSIQIEVGCFITLVATFELLVRFNPLRIPDFTPLTRLNTMFDGSALVAAIISSIGIMMHLFEHEFALEYILVGRAMDTIRVLRFFQIFRDICRRASDVLPALIGPLALVISTMHVFIYAGMAIWGGAIDVGQYQGKITDLYDLNNFNSYHEGAVTIFQVLVVNDWYAIAEVYLLASKNSSPYIVYSFFITANLICVSVMLNVLTAFFVGSFVTKLPDDTDAPSEITATVQNDQSYILMEPDVRRVSSTRNVDNLLKTDSTSTVPIESERFEFDVYERQCYDKIMQTVAGAGPQGDVARDICHYLEIFEKLTPGRETIGYLVCDHQTQERFGNRRFRTRAIGFLDENMLHKVVTDMHSELIIFSSQNLSQLSKVEQTFPHKRASKKILEINGSLLRRYPPLTIFVSRVVINDKKNDLK